MPSVNEVAEFNTINRIGVLSLNSPPVNALSASVRAGLLAGVQRAAEDDAVDAVVLICRGRTFIAGADITEFGGPAKGPGLTEVQEAIENSSKPVIAAIHGTALGGGLEVALCCHYRVALESARCGLPEVNLGLLPGAGGTQRLPRLVGVETALEMVTSGRHVPAAECLKLGLIDQIAPEGDLESAALAFAEQVVAEKRPLRKVRDINDKLEAARGRPEIFEAFRKGIARKTRGFLAPEYNVQCIEAAVNLNFTEGLAVESQLFTELLKGPQSAAQRHAFFAEREIWKLPDVPRDTPQIEIHKVGIIGAGTMGGGIAMNFANIGLPVTLVETNQEALDRGLAVIRANYERSASRGRLSPEEVEERVNLIAGSLEMEKIADVDLVIEAVFESMPLKKEIFERLDAIIQPNAILASNTSALDVNEIAHATKRPESVIGLHFFSPANVMQLVEVVRGDASSDAVIATSMAIAKRIGKKAALVGVCPGFVGNRILAPRQFQANQLILEGAMPWDVDRVLFDFGLPMGPFAMSDLAGLDIGWDKAKSKGQTVRDVLCEMDRRGQKTGAGYYDYDESRQAAPSPVVEKIIQDFATRGGREARSISDDEILARCIYPMINEGVKILAEGKAIRASDIDVIWMSGYGWPVYRGGPMFYAEQVGLAQVLSRLEELAAEYGEAFTPAPLLTELVAQEQSFRDRGF
ncbi:MAG: 3-hydroxyacyl-CoA dehydrogenase [Deltaproteobacteria bacterium]|nr:3-hydroxyacyl-CoA dehydrogenase [Deltaproteobacteria bacterium]